MFLESISHGTAQSWGERTPLSAFALRGHCPHFFCVFPRGVLRPGLCLGWALSFGAASSGGPLFGSRWVPVWSALRYGLPADLDREEVPHSCPLCALCALSRPTLGARWRPPASRTSPLRPARRRRQQKAGQRPPFFSLLQIQLQRDPSPILRWWVPLLPSPSVTELALFASQRPKFRPVPRKEAPCGPRTARASLRGGSAGPRGIEGAGRQTQQPLKELHTDVSFFPPGFFFWVLFFLLGGPLPAACRRAPGPPPEVGGPPKCRRPLRFGT